MNETINCYWRQYGFFLLKWGEYVQKIHLATDFLFMNCIFVLEYCSVSVQYVMSKILNHLELSKVRAPSGLYYLVLRTTCVYIELQFWDPFKDAFWTSSGGLKLVGTFSFTQIYSASHKFLIFYTNYVYFNWRPMYHKG